MARNRVSFALLPTELWLSITAYLTQSNLAFLSLTCSRLLTITRPLFFRSVFLKASIGNTTVSLTLDLLARDHTLAKSVIELTLFRVIDPNYPPYYYVKKGPSLVNVDALTNMVALKRITIVGPIFCNEVEQREFARVLEKSRLRDFNLVGRTDREIWPGEGLGIRGLKKVLWRPMDEYFLKPMWDVLSSSRTTIHTLSLPFPMSSNCSRLWNMHFPNLRSVTLGAWNPHTPSGKDFTDFILAHATIEELDLEYVKSRRELSFDSSSLTRLHADVLPLLHSLRGSASTLSTMAQARMRCLMNIRRLVVGPSKLNAPAPELQSMFDAIMNYVGDDIDDGDCNSAVNRLSVLEEIDLDLSALTENQRGHIGAVIYQCARFCGHSLEVWRGTLPADVQMQASELGPLFALFGRLKVIYMDGRIVPRAPGEKGTTTGYVRSLSESCPALREVVMKYPGHGKDEKWLIQRGLTAGGNTLQRVTG